MFWVNPAQFEGEFMSKSQFGTGAIPRKFWVGKMRNSLKRISFHGNSGKNALQISGKILRNSCKISEIFPGTFFDEDL